MKSAFTVDLEDWFCSHNLKSVIKYQDWDKLESRVERNTISLLNFLNKNKITATFFVLGWIADRFPDLILAIHNEGHEIASHGYAHRQVTSQNPKEFEQDIIRSIHSLMSIIGAKPKGYRAPAFSITAQTTWALPILKRNGIIYDSSIYPFSLHPEYGNPEIQLKIHTVQGIIEVPLSCYSIGNFRIPCSGGAYLRFYPFPLFKYLAKSVVKQQQPFIFYIHPWEIDKDGPKIRLQVDKSLRHYYNIGATFPKMEALANEIEFTSIENILSI